MVEPIGREGRRKIRRLISGVYDLNSFSGIPNHSLDCERDRVFPLQECWDRNIRLNMGKVNYIQLIKD